MYWSRRKLDFHLLSRFDVLLQVNVHLGKNCDWEDVRLQGEICMETKVGPLWKYCSLEATENPPESRVCIKVAFSQKGLMRLSFLQTVKPNYFPELEFWFFFHTKWLKLCQIRTWTSLKLLWMLKKGIIAASSSFLTWFEAFRMKKKKNQNSCSGK